MAHGSIRGKDIASYLRRDVRTVIRWEKRKGLPVRRVPGGQRKAVFAYTSELDAWLNHDREPQEVRPTAFEPTDGTSDVVSLPALMPPDAAPFQPSIPAAISRGSRLIYSAGAVVVMAGVLLFALLGLRSPAVGSRLPARVGFAFNSVQVFDDKDKLLWTHTFLRTLGKTRLSDGKPIGDIWRVADFRGAGDREVLIAVWFSSPNMGDDSVGMEVDCFSSRGELLWSYVPKEKFQFGKNDIQGPWILTDILVSSGGGRTQIWLALMHHLWGNSFVVSLDPATGKDNLRFVNTGTIRTLGELVTPHGSFLLAGGFNNEYDSGALAVLDEAKDFAASPQTARHKCGTCPQGNPDQYFVFPRSEINQLEEFYEDRVFWLRVTDGQVEVHKTEKVKENDGSDGVGTIYMLGGEGALRPLSVRFDTNYDMLHRKLEQEGKIHHTLENCPERLHPRPIRVWTPAAGWTEIELGASRASE